MPSMSKFIEASSEASAYTSNVYAGAILLVAAALAGGFGNAWVVGRYLEGITRQPEAASQLRTALFIGIGLVEALPIIAVAFGIIKLVGGKG